MKDLLDKLANLPGSIKAGLAGAVVVLAFACGLAGRSAIWIVLTIVILFALLVGGYLLWRAWKQRQESARFANDLKQQGTAAPRSISDPGKLKDLDNLRRRFEDGLAEYKSRGKDLYSLPWFLIVGESGSGKTEAIRHCNVGFPPGMQDEMQGAGGTVNMNWWFTNHGVFLDTAGRMIFEEVKPGETSEWREFLKLLRKSRPNCPINGLLLVIPADSLLKDSAEKIKARGGRIAQQLDVIQRSLDIRFPVFLVVTKGDLLVGFREFSDSVTEPALQHQIIGWSNPDPLDAPFRSELLTQHLTVVAERLQRRILGLLRDPVAANPPTRRLSEVDSLYALPNTLVADIGPGLRRYLEAIFVAGEWSAKPLFLRGIYFTSSLREGSVLDQEVAQALGITVTDLPQGRVWERERSFFLRDLFVEKVFREKGLVTRATNAAKMLLRRRIMLASSGTAALLLFLLIAGLGMRQLRLSVREQSTHWKAAVTPAPIVQEVSGDYMYRGDTQVALGHESIVEFQQHLTKLAGSRLKTGWVFRPILWIVPLHELDLRHAQRLVFERDVLDPLVTAARKKMLRNQAHDSRELRTAQAGALLSLVQIETGIVRRQEERKPGPPLQPDDVRRFLGPLVAYDTGVGGATNDVDNRLVETMVWTYSPKGDRRAEWPPTWLSAGTSLWANEPIRNGLNQITGKVFGLPLEDKPNAEPLLVDQLKQVGDAMYVLEDELVKAADTENQRNDSASAQELTQRAKRIQVFSDVAHALLDTNGVPISCRIVLDANQGSAASFFRYIKVVSGKKDNGRQDTTKKADAVLSELGVDGPLDLQIYKYASDTRTFSDRPYRAWGPIALLAYCRDGAKLIPGGKGWKVNYPVADGSTSNLVLRIEFDKPLPDLSQWLTP